ncbi:MAG: hypothetical protein ACLQM6_06110 [Acidobacteriaceae bacterium]
MRDLWRCSKSLIRQYPILWLPVAIVEFIDVILGWLERLFRHWLIQKLFLWMSEEHSVLSKSPVYGQPTQHVMNQVMIITVPLGWCILLLYNVLLACAIVAMASMLQRIPEAGTGTLRDTVAPVKSSIRRIMVFAITLFGLNVIGQSITAFLTALIQFPNLNHLQSALEQMLEHILSLSVRSQIALEHSNLIVNLFGILWPIPITLCVVYIIAPLQVRLLQPPDTNPTAQQVRSARIVWLLAIVTSTLATCARVLLQTGLVVALQSPVSISYLFQVVTPLISVAIYTPLFIAIYLIANPGSPLAIPPIPPGIPPEEEDVPPTEEAT